jgi:phosphoribosyl-ATP pyrophosphohydrolase
LAAIERKHKPKQKALNMADTLHNLERVIASRRGAAPDESYVASLNARGLEVMAQKLGEEATEAVIAAVTQQREELIGESADVLFHLLVLLNASDVSLDDVLAELDRREGLSGIAEKESRKQP